MQSKIQPWWLIVLGGALLIFSSGGKAPAWPSLDSILERFAIVDPAVGRLATDAESWARTVNRPRECELIAKCFDRAAMFNGSSEDLQTALRLDIDKAIPKDIQLDWIAFRTNFTTRLRLLRDSGKVDASSKSHSAYMRAIAQGVRRAG